MADNYLSGLLKIPNLESLQTMVDCFVTHYSMSAVSHPRKGYRMPFRILGLQLQSVFVGTSFVHETTAYRALIQMLTTAGSDRPSRYPGWNLLMSRRKRGLQYRRRSSCQYDPLHVASWFPHPGSAGLKWKVNKTLSPKFSRIFCSGNASKMRRKYPTTFGHGGAQVHVQK